MASSIGSHEAIIFRKFRKEAVAELTVDQIRSAVPATAGLGTGEKIVLGPDLNAVELLINPYEVTFATPKEVQKTRTLSRGRYVVQDWGPDLTTVSLKMQTGNMLPYRSAPLPAPIVPAPFTGGINAFQSVPQVVNFDTQGYLNLNASGTPEVTTGLAGGYPYTGLLLASPRFLTFLEFYILYHEFDANNDILLMTFSRGIFRGYLTNWTFTVDANNPWNWKFGADFVVVQGLESLIGGTLDTFDTGRLLRANGALEDLKIPENGIVQFFDESLGGLFDRI